MARSASETTRITSYNVCYTKLLRDLYSLDEDGVLTVGPLQGLLANDSDANEDVLEAVLVEAPQHGQLVLQPDGSFTYTPDPDFNGLDQFTYRASDGELSDTATVLLTVNPINDAPVHEFNPMQQVDEDTKLVFSARRDNALTIRDVDVITSYSIHYTKLYESLPW